MPLTKDDADEEKFPDMEKNPFAELADNESLYIDDPKKMIEKWYDREGYDFDKSHYQVNLSSTIDNTST